MNVCLRRIGGIVWIAVMAAGSAGAQTLYGIGFSGDDGLSTLYTVSTANGAAVAVGPVGFERCSGMEIDSSGQAFAACERTGDDTPVLVSIDLATGAGTEIGATGMTGAVSDLSFRGDGTLFAYDASNDPTHSLFTVIVGTGAGTLVGDTGLGFAGGNGMTFSLGGTLFHSQFTDGPAPDLNSLDPSNGTPTFLGQISPLTGRFASMDVDPVSGVIYGVVKNGAGGGGPTDLATLDPAGPSATVLGTTEPSLDAIAFFGGQAPPSVLEIPTVGSFGLGALALLLGVAAAVRLAAGRRSRT